jgi:hypothetical protein
MAHIALFGLRNLRGKKSQYAYSAFAPYIREQCGKLRHSPQVSPAGSFMHVSRVQALSVQHP